MKKHTSSSFGVAGLGTWLAWGLVAFFLINLAGVVFSVVLDSVATRWLSTALPEGLTLRWYADAWDGFSLSDVVKVTVEVAVATVLISLVLGVPAAYALARRQFPGKRFVMLSFLLPILTPPLTYGIPLATLLYRLHFAGHIPGVILANLVPAVPFVIIVTTPFIEQIDPKIETAARMCGAGTLTMFRRILVPLLLPGILAAAVLVLVRTIGQFELTFFTAGTDSQTLVVALYNALYSAGMRAPQSIDAMAVMYMLTTLVLLVIALRFVNPTRLVARVRD
jgi:putative spermidine/putrescine transport system permease protein